MGKIFVPRPLYETQKDLAHEKYVAKKIATAYGLRLQKMHKKLSIDFMAFNKSGLAVAVIEVKRRHSRHNKYPTIILSLMKFNRGVEFYRSNNLNFIFVVEFDDGIYAYQYLPDDIFKISFGGRTDRGDSQDMEPVIQIPINKMEKI